MTSKRSRHMDRLFLFLCIAGLLALSFIAGAASLYYPSSFARSLYGALEGGKAWVRQIVPAFLASGAAIEQRQGKIEDSLQQSSVEWDKERAFNGYTLFSTRAGTTAYLIDMEGHVVHEWKTFFKPEQIPQEGHPSVNARVFMESAQLFSNGDLIAQYSGLGDTPYGYGLVKIDKDSNLIWAYSETTHHHFHIDRATGDIYTLVHKIVQDPPPGLEGLPYPLLTDYIVRLSADGKEQDRIPVLEAFRDSPFAGWLFKKGDWDFLHSNLVVRISPEMAGHFPMLKPGQLLISIRNLDTLAAIDPATRTVTWAMKGPWKGQHAPQLLTNGHILLFDNIGYVWQGRNFVRALEIDPATGAIAWEFTGTPELPLESVLYGYLQRLPNGNTLIGESMNNRIIEVTADKKVVWKYSLPLLSGESPLNGVMSATRYTPDELPFLKSR